MTMLRTVMIACALLLPLSAAAEAAETEPSELCGGEKGEHKDPTADKDGPKPEEDKSGDKPAPDKPEDKPAGDKTGKS